MSEPKFKRMDKVQKVSGYKFPGIVLTSYFTLDGKLRYVVEAATPEFRGMQHIFNEEQLELREH